MPPFLNTVFRSPLSLRLLRDSLYVSNLIDLSASCSQELDPCDINLFVFVGVFKITSFCDCSHLAEFFYFFLLLRVEHHSSLPRSLCLRMLPVHGCSLDISDFQPKDDHWRLASFNIGCIYLF
ncbi:hypothetical protein BpHYR1_045441 [Brachionus plicatilis]|uniref:Uncharacterized protein n=1 Tax=Brachionus plicatilis TaxID=10195 RepID=A0A3M7PGX3_BRAPC|nr:hypothetical protein BpHYR1_045441 [Brachionus plicatilis]